MCNRISQEVDVTGLHATSQATSPVTACSHHITKTVHREESSSKQVAGIMAATGGEAPRLGALGPRLAGRLTAELILRCPQYMNCLKQYEIDLRGAPPLDHARRCAVRCVPRAFALTLLCRQQDWHYREHGCDRGGCASLRDLQTASAARSGTNVCCPCSQRAQNQFDSIDLTDNSIVRLEGFPRLPRLTQLLLSNNRVMRIGKNCHGE
jgi:hypothetical protein